MALFPIPQRWEDYLEHRYGEAWSIPNRDWTYFLDDGTINLLWSESSIFHNWSHEDVEGPE